MFHVKHNSYTNPTYEPFHAQSDEFNGSIEFMQSYPVVGNWYGRSFSCFVGRRAIATDKHFRSPEMLLQVGVFSYSVLPCQDALLNSSRTAANDFDAK